MVVGTVKTDAQAEQLVGNVTSDKAGPVPPASAERLRLLAHEEVQRSLKALKEAGKHLTDALAHTRTGSADVLHEDLYEAETAFVMATASFERLMGYRKEILAQEKGKVSDGDRK